MREEEVEAVSGEMSKMWEYEYRSGEFTWLFAGDDVINMRQVRRFSLSRDTVTGDRVTVFYLDGTPEDFYGEVAVVIWKALCKASESVNIKAK